MADNNGIVIPEEDSKDDIARRQHSLLSFYSFLQKFYNIESLLSKFWWKNEKLPPQAFDVMDNLWIANISMKTTLFLEFFLFTFILFPLFILVKSGVWVPFESAKGYSYSAMLHFFTFSSLIFSTLVYFFISKLYLPNTVVVKNAILVLFFGRVAALFLKAMLFFIFVLLVGAWLFMPENMALTVKLIKDLVSTFGINIPYEETYYKLMKMEPIVYREMYFVPAVFIISSGLIFIPIIQKELKFRGSLNPKYSKDLFKKDKVHLGFGWDLDSETEFKIESVYLPNASRNVHTAVVGTTKTGKTKMLEYLIEQDIRAGHSVLVIDPKGKEIFDKVIQIAIEEGRVDDIIYISPLYPEFSAGFNPLSDYFMPEEIVSHVIAGVKSSEEYFINVAKAITVAIVSGLRHINKDNPDFVFNFAQILEYTSSEKLEELGGLLSDNMLRLTDPKEKEEMEIALKNIEMVASFPPDFFSKVASGLNVVLTVLTSENIGKIIGNSRENKFVNMINEGKSPIIVIETASMMVAETSGIIAKVVLSMVKSLCGRFDSHKMKFKHPLMIHIDELATALFPEMRDLFDKGRSAGAYVTGYFQSINQIYAELGREDGNALLDNVNNYIVFRVQKDTATYFSELFGDMPVPKLIFNSVNHYIINKTREAFVDASTIQNLPDRTFFLYKKPEGTNFWKHSRNSYFVRVPFIPDPYIDVEFPSKFDEGEINDK